MRLGVDGHWLHPRFVAGGLDARRPAGEVSLGAGRHRVLLVPGPPGTVAYIQAVALERVSRPTAGPLCAGGRRYRAERGRPVTLTLDAARSVRNCGTAPLRLDWVAPAAG
jgi:hypothetical protein